MYYFKFIRYDIYGFFYRNAVHKPFSSMNIKNNSKPVTTGHWTSFTAVQII